MQNDRESVADVLALKAHYPDYLSDPAGLARLRSAVLENNGHDMAAINYNSLGRLLDTIERLRTERDDPRHRLTAPTDEEGNESALVRCTLIEQASNLAFITHGPQSKLGNALTAALARTERTS